MADLATLQTRLSEAEAAYHRLMTGTLEVEVQHGDMRMKYEAGKTGPLLAYIEGLRAQIADAGGTVSGLRRRGMVVDL